MTNGTTGSILTYMTSTRIPVEEVKVGDTLHTFGQQHTIVRFDAQSAQAVFPGRLAKSVTDWGIALLDGDWIATEPQSAGGLWVERR